MPKRKGQINGMSKYGLDESRVSAGRAGGSSGPSPADGRGRPERTTRPGRENTGPVPFVRLRKFEDHAGGGGVRDELAPGVGQAGLGQGGAAAALQDGAGAGEAAGGEGDRAE